MLGGGEIALFNLVVELDRRRYVPVVLLGADGPLASRLREASIETQVLPMSDGVLNTRKDSLGVRGLLKGGTALRSGTYALRLAEFVRRGQFALIHTNSLKADVIGGIAGRLTGTPVLWHVRDRIAEDYLPKAAVRLFRLLSRLIPNYVIANSQATLDTLPNSKSKGSTAIPSGLRVDRENNPVRVVHDGLSAYEHGPCGHGGGSRRVGLVGRIAPWKGQDVFLRAAAQVRRQHPDILFQVIGAPLFHEADFELELRKLSTSLGLDGCVEFTGFRDDVPALIAQLDVLVHASKSPEPFGQVVAEGMLAGKPVVATRGGGVLEIVQDGITGKLVPMNDHGSMASAICELLDDPQAASQMGVRARQRILDHFTIAQTAAKIQDVYDRMLHVRSHAPD